jgi:hypothetical protein
MDYHSLKMRDIARARVITPGRFSMRFFLVLQVPIKAMVMKISETVSSRIVCAWISFTALKFWGNDN